MDRTVCALLLLCASAFFLIAGARDFSKYEKFEGLISSVEKDLDRQISHNRRHSKRAAPATKPRDDMTVHELLEILQRLEAGEFTRGWPIRIEPDVPVRWLVSILGRLETGEISIKPARSYTAAPARERKIASASSSEDTSSGAAGYGKAAPGTKKTAKSSVKSASSTTEPSIAKYLLPTIKVVGIPGKDYPNYTDIPETDFSCFDKPTIPGFYADLDTDCQVFHVCWPDERETLLCPVGTTFNQAILACDYWYNHNCSLAPLYYSVNMGDTGLDTSEGNKQESVSSMIDVLLESSAGDPSIKGEASKTKPEIAASALSFVSKLLPVKAKIFFYPESKKQASQSTEYVSDDSEVRSTEEIIAEDSDPEILTYSETPAEDTTEEILAEDPETSSQPEIPVDAEMHAKDPVEELPMSDEGIRPLWSLEYRMDQALMEAYKDLNDYFAPLLESHPPDSDMVRYKDAYTNVIFQMRHLLRLFSPVDKFVPGTEIWPEKDHFFRSKARAFRAWFVSIMKNAISKLLLEKWSRRPVEYPKPAKVVPPKKGLKPLTKENFKAIWQLYKIALKNVEGEQPPKQIKSESTVSKETKKAIMKNYLKFFKMNTKTFLYYGK